VLFISLSGICSFIMSFCLQSVSSCFLYPSLILSVLLLFVLLMINMENEYNNQTKSKTRLLWYLMLFACLRSPSHALCCCLLAIWCLICSLLLCVCLFMLCAYPLLLFGVWLYIMCVFNLNRVSFIHYVYLCSLYFCSCSLFAHYVSNLCRLCYLLNLLRSLRVLNLLKLS